MFNIYHIIYHFRFQFSYEINLADIVILQINLKIQKLISFSSAIKCNAEL